MKRKGPYKRWTILSSSITGLFSTSFVFSSFNNSHLLISISFPVTLPFTLFPSDPIITISHSFSSSFPFSPLSFSLPFHYFDVRLAPGSTAFSVWSFDLIVIPHTVRSSWWTFSSGMGLSSTKASSKQQQQEHRAGAAKRENERPRTRASSFHFTKVAVRGHKKGRVAVH